MKLDHYKTIFLPATERQRSAVHPRLYHCAKPKSQKDIWSVTLPFPVNMVPFGLSQTWCMLILTCSHLFASHWSQLGLNLWSRRTRSRDKNSYIFVAVSKEVQDAASFDNTINNTAEVALGPLEYCGNGLVVHRQRAGRANPM